MANLKAIMRGGESATLEFKETCPIPWKIGRVIASFANAAGGVIVVGVDDGGNIVGTSDPEKEIGVLELALEYCDPRPALRIETLRHDLKDIVVARVEANEFPLITHVDCDGHDVAYFRVGRETRPVDREVVKLAVKLRRRSRGDRDLDADGRKLLNWLWSKGEASEKICARRFNWSTHRLRKLAETVVGAGYMLPVNIGTGRSYVAIHPGPKQQGR